MRQKRFILAGIALVLTLFVCLSFAGCKKSNERSSNSTTGVVSNGGMAVKKGNTLYFIAGTQSASSVASGRTSNSAIWKVETDENGNYTTSPEVFVDALVGFEFSSLHIFGDWLYYVTPSTTKDREGNTESGISDFCRVSLTNKTIQKIYSVSTEENDELQYAYYPMGNDFLYLVVFENSTGNLISVDVGTRSQAKTIATEVTGIVFAENGETEGVNRFVFYSHAKGKKALSQTGNVVERILPDGTGKQSISENAKTTSILAIRDGKLLYSVNDTIYESTGEGQLSTKTDKKVSSLATSSYDDVYMTSTYILVKKKIDNKNTIMYLAWNENGELVEYSLCQADAEFLCVYGNRLFYRASSNLYVVNIAENQDAIKVTEQVVDAAGDILVPEVIDGYLYFFSTDTDTLLYRVSASATNLVTAEKVIG